MTDTIGPPLAELVHRLAECPPEFLLSPMEVSTASIVRDHLLEFAALIPAPREADRALSASGEKELNRLKVVAVAVWLLHDDWFLARPELGPAMWKLLSEGLTPLGLAIKAEEFVHDPDRREELARVCLRELGLRPEGETAAQSTDRLSSLDSLERVSILEQTRAAEVRARKLREALARKAAEEAAARASPE